MERFIDARGEQCPIPVVKAKKGLTGLEAGDHMKVLVDNEIAMENLLKMAKQLKIHAKGEKEETGFLVEFFYGGQTLPNFSGDGRETCTPAEGPDQPTELPPKKNTVVVISKNTMGSGSEELGGILMKGFLYALNGLEELPSAVLFYNSGVMLTCQGGESLEDLKGLEAQGVEILSCGTCLDYYGLKEKLALGTVTNMYEIVERQNQADLLIQP